MLIICGSRTTTAFPTARRRFLKQNLETDVEGYHLRLMFRLRRWPASPAKDHLSNSLVFGPDGKLYMTQGSNSAMGDPDPAWYKRSERLLNGSVLQIDPS